MTALRLRKAWFILLLALASCDKLFIAPDPPNTAAQNFDLLWQTIDEKYGLFAFKSVDWNATRATYRPLALRASNNQQLFKVLADMLNELRDGHVNLTSSFDVSRNWEWYLGFPANYNATLVERNYLARDYQLAGPFANREIRQVGYVRYASFQSSFGESTLDAVLDKYRNSKGLIIDIRDNGGGALSLADRLLSRFLAQDTDVGFVRYRRGPAHDDFTDYEPIRVKKEGTRYTRPVVVLTNRKSYSAANYFATMMAQIDNVTLVGDQTGGGGGLPISAELPNGWRVRYSSAVMYDNQKRPLELGAVPRLKVNLTPADEANGVDTILEAALRSFN